MPILVGTDGVQKMSKSLGNYVALEEPPAEMYGKIMSLPDDLLLQYYEYLTDVPDADIAAMNEAMASETANPMDFKKQLARIITTTFHDGDSARGAEAQFEQVVQRRDLPDEMPEYSLAAAADLAINHLLVQSQLAASNSEARRLVGQGAVEIIRASGQRIAVAAAGEPTPELAPGDVIRAGRRRFVRLVQ
jgi:tyrosyl-tRNA synthetase